tara:strand:+ start:1459 stop:1878 length:420 start_codon:yes stop_codon:yes gene_type:complete
MATTLMPQTFPYDVRFADQMEPLRQAHERVYATPVDYTRRGGTALLSRGDMYGSLYDAAARATAERRAAEQRRRTAWAAQADRNRIQAAALRNQSIADLVSGGVGLAGDEIARLRYRDNQANSTTVRPAVDGLGIWGAE